MGNRRNDLLIAACIGVGSFVLGFITAKLACGCKKSACSCDDECICCGAECDGVCEACDFADDCECGIE